MEWHFWGSRRFSPDSWAIFRIGSCSKFVGRGRLLSSWPSSFPESMTERRGERRFLLFLKQVSEQTSSVHIFRFLNADYFEDGGCDVGDNADRLGGHGLPVDKFPAFKLISNYVEGNRIWVVLGLGLAGHRI